MTSATPPSLSSMAGGQQAGAAQGQPSPASSSDGAASLQQSVIQDFMLAEKALMSAASKIPQFAPIADSLINQLRSQGASVLNTAAQPSGAPSSPMQGIMSSVGQAPGM
jgi:hypothetical protein